MKVFVVGYTDRTKTAEGRVLYAGNDKARGEDALNAGGPGVLRATLFLHPHPHKSRHFDTPNENGIQPESAGNEGVTLDITLCPEWKAFVDETTAQVEALKLEADQRVAAIQEQLTAANEATDLANERHDNLLERLTSGSFSEFKRIAEMKPAEFKAWSAEFLKAADASAGEGSPKAAATEEPAAPDLTLEQ